jgi:phospholipid/cholesterol/gamma-HCH transport system substrate-binding protein
MFKGDRNFTVGLFVTVAIAVFVAFVIWLTGRSGAEELTRYTLKFTRDVSGLAVGGPVNFMGMNIGSVVHMDLEKNEGVRVRVDIEILATTPVNQGTYASLALQGITGVAVVTLASEPGQHAPLAAPPKGEYPEIPVRAVGFAAVLASAPQIMNKLDSVLTRVGELLGQDNRTKVNETLQHVEQLTAALAGSSDTMARLPQEVSQAVSDIQTTLGQLQDLLGQLQPGLASTVANLDRSSENLASLTTRFDQLMGEHERDLDGFVADGLGEVPELMRQTRATLRDLEKLVAELQDDPSQLIHRPPTDSLEIDP